MPPATLRQKRAQETRQLILDAAHRVFSAHGYGQTSVDTIIAAAGISKGAFYHHFDSKGDLFAALLDYRVRRCADQIAGATGTATSLREAVEYLARTGVQSYKDDPEWMRLYMEFWLQATRDPSARDAVARSMRECRELVAGMLRAGQRAGAVRSDLDADAAAAILSGVFDGAILQAAVDPEAVNLGALVPLLVELIERFIEPQSVQTEGGRT